MNKTSVYLAKHRTTSRQRAHFTLFIPNAAEDHANLSTAFQSIPCKGTVIHVIGEPVFAGSTFEFKRNFEPSRSLDLVELVFLDHVDPEYLYKPPYDDFRREFTPRGKLDREAAMVDPPRRGQNLRAPINTKRCQEWTMEYLQRLADKHIIDAEAVQVAQNHRDPPDHGIFGRQAVVRGSD